MAISKQSLISRVNDLSKKKGVHQNIVLRSYFFDVFLKRLSVSKYSDDFVIKGGFLLSSRMGLDLRTTKDLDFLLRKIELEKQISPTLFPRSSVWMWGTTSVLN